MNMPVGLVLVLVFISSTANTEAAEITIMNMTDAKPFDEIPCPQNCGGLLTIGMTAVSALLGSFLNNIPMEVDFCQDCLLGGLGGFTLTHTCFMSPEKNVFDHHLVMQFPHVNVDCQCDFSNRATSTAEKINAAKTVEGQCGEENYKNKHVCKPIVCEGDEGGDGQSLIKLITKIKNSEIKSVLRFDTRNNPITKKPNVFPLYFSVTTGSDDFPLTHEGPSEFDVAWQCLLDNLDGLLCRLLSNMATPFYDCLHPGQAPSLVHSVLLLFGAC